ncbi:MAG TPA: hypothetical protein VHK91_06535 [Flavisolibacter sp.]|jgi:transcriptional regulator|nr:hypothetical protein [Flavisolibacter sp.]
MEKAILTYHAQQRNELLLIRLTTVTGRQLMNKIYTARAGVNQIEVAAVRNLQKGLYYLDLINGNRIIETQRIIKD